MYTLLLLVLLLLSIIIKMSGPMPPRSCPGPYLLLSFSRLATCFVHIMCLCHVCTISIQYELKFTWIGNPQKFCVAILVWHELFMIAMAASELDETNGEDRGTRECTPLMPEFCLNFFIHFLTLGIRSIVIKCYIKCPLRYHFYTLHRKPHVMHQCIVHVY